jgi:hypothetical protein
MKRCLLLLAALAAIPSTFALPAGEFPLAPLPTGAAPYERRRPEVAASKELYLAVWEDARVKPNQPRLWAARVTRGGQLLDPTGIYITTFAEDSLIGTHVRSVASDGTDFLVAWSDDEGRLGIAKVTADGKVIHPPNPNIGGDGATLLYMGTVYALFATDRPTVPFVGGGVGAATLDRDGRVIVRTGVPVSRVRSIAATMNGNRSEVYFGWLEVGSTDVHVARLSPSEIETGSITPDTIIVADTLSSVPTNLSIASDGSDAYAVWIDESVVPNVYRAIRLPMLGGPTPSVVTLGNASIFTAKPTVTWNGAEYVVVYKDFNGLAVLQRVAQDGNPSAPPIVVSGPVTEVTIASLPAIDDSIVVWNDIQGPVNEVSANLISPVTNVFRLPGNVLLSTSFADRSDATVVWRGNHYLGAWRDALDSSRIVVGRFTADGVPLDGTGVQVGATAPGGPAPVLASNGQTAVVAWLDLNGVGASFVDASGRVVRLSYDFPGGQPTVNWNGQQYLVAWRSSGGRLLALRINPNGQLIDNQAVDIAPFAGRPYLGWTGSAYVVASQVLAVCAAPCQQTGAIFAQIVSPALVATGTPIQISDTVALPPSLADSPGGTLIVWPRLDGTTTTLRGVRVFNGAVLDPLNGFAIGAGSQPTVYGSAAGWGVVSGPNLWLVSRNGAVSARFVQFPFVPADARASVVLGGPEPLVVYRRDPVGSEQMMQVVAHYALTPGRTRAARH